LLFSGAGLLFYSILLLQFAMEQRGLAKVAILASGLFGMISGSPVANASTVGVITIPMMKKSGYPGDFCCFSGTCDFRRGILMPPVMGSVAFVMAEVIGIPYVKVATAAFFTGSAVFPGIILFHRFQGSEYGLQGLPKNEIPPLRNTIKQGCHSLYQYYI
jgi:TRAP-type uncharacterized transport system fused permease subunit